MSILKELLALAEAPEVPVELKDVIAAFPKNHSKALRHLWGGKRLVWHGERFFDDGELGSAYTKAEEAAVEYINDGYETDTYIDVDFSTFNGRDGEIRDTDFEWMTKFSDREGGERQECYLGYDPKRDKLYIGFDAWVSEEEFNSEFDTFFERATGEDFNSDRVGHQEVFDRVWEEYKNRKYGFWGIIFEISHNGGHYTAEEAMPPEPGGFYSKQFRQFRARHPDVVDLRLD